MASTNPFMAQARPTHAISAGQPSRKKAITQTTPQKVTYRSLVASSSAVCDRALIVGHVRPPAARRAAAVGRRGSLRDGPAHQSMNCGGSRSGRDRSSRCADRRARSRADGSSQVFARGVGHGGVEIRLKAIAKGHRCSPVRGTDDRPGGAVVVKHNRPARARQTFSERDSYRDGRSQCS